MDRFLMKLKMFFFFLYFFFDVAFRLFLFIYSVLLSFICNYIPGVCNFFTSGFAGC